jgi:hypothetical protein
MAQDQVNAIGRRSEELRTEGGDGEELTGSQLSHDHADSPDANSDHTQRDQTCRNHTRRDQTGSHDAEGNQTECNRSHSDAAHGNNANRHDSHRGVADRDQPARSGRAVTTTFPAANGDVHQWNPSPALRRSILVPRHLGSSAMRFDACRDHTLKAAS